MTRTNLDSDDDAVAVGTKTPAFHNHTDVDRMSEVVAELVSWQPS